MFEIGNLRIESQAEVEVGESEYALGFGNVEKGLCLSMRFVPKHDFVYAIRSSNKV